MHFSALFAFFKRAHSYLFGKKFHAEGSSPQNVPGLRAEKGETVTKKNDAFFPDLTRFRGSQDGKMARGVEWGGRTHPPESTGETTRTNGGSKGKLSWKRQKQVSPQKRKAQGAVALLYSLCRRSLAGCNPSLLSPSGPAGQCAGDCRDPPFRSEKRTLLWLFRGKDNVKKNKKNPTYVLNLTCHSYRLSFTSSTE